MKIKEVTEFIETAPEGQKEIMEMIREIIHENLEGVIEEFKWNRPVFKLKNDFAYLQAHKNYVTLGFFKDFVKIPDFETKLEGTGKTMRHLKIKTPKDVNSDELISWFKILTQV